jgi:hypothetical protein
LKFAARRFREEEEAMVAAALVQTQESLLEHNLAFQALQTAQFAELQQEQAAVLVAASETAQSELQAQRAELQAQRTVLSEEQHKAISLGMAAGKLECQIEELHHQEEAILIEQQQRALRMAASVTGVGLVPKAPMPHACPGVAPVTTGMWTLHGAPSAAAAGLGSPGPAVPVARYAYTRTVVVQPPVDAAAPTCSHPDCWRPVQVLQGLHGGTYVHPDSLCVEHAAQALGVTTGDAAMYQYMMQQPPPQEGP